MQKQWPDLGVLNVNFPAGAIKGCRQTFISRYLVYEANVEKTIDGTFKYTTYTKRSVEPEQGSD